MRGVRQFFAVLALWAAVSATARAQERQIRVDVIVRGTPESLWPLWTTNAGVRSFFAPGSNIEPRVDGLYEIYFDPSAPAGRRGADGMRVLAFQPHRRLAFTWNAPEHLGAIRDQRTIVSVEFTPVGRDSTRVTLRHAGWGTGPEWDAALAYFEPAWNAFVMPMFKRRVEHGPVDWRALPSLLPAQPSAIQTLVVSP
jgi:uncharacterized protein YndB with AHSA1/START domain